MGFKMFSRYDKKALFIYSGLALLFIYPLIQAGIYYRDDLDRSITGYYGWRGLGRPFADIIPPSLYLLRNPNTNKLRVYAHCLPY